MRDDTIPQTVLFPDLFNKPLIATFDQPHASSDGGAILLKAANARYPIFVTETACEGVFESLIAISPLPSVRGHPIRDVV